MSLAVSCAAAFDAAFFSETDIHKDDNGTPLARSPDRAAVEHCRKRKNAPSATPRIVKHGRPGHFSLRLKVYDEYDDGVTAVFAGVNDKCSSVDAVALWPQYEVSFEGFQCGDKTFIILSSQQSWFKQLIATVISGATRDTIRDVFKEATQDFDAASRLKRQEFCRHQKENELKRLFDDNGEDPEDLSEDDASCQLHYTLTITLAECNVEVLNYRRRRSLCVNDATVRCIRMWLVPLAFKRKAPPRTATPKFDIANLQQLASKAQKVVWNDDEQG